MGWLLAGVLSIPVLVFLWCLWTIAAEEDGDCNR